MNYSFQQLSHVKSFKVLSSSAEDKFETSIKFPSLNVVNRNYFLNQFEECKNRSNQIILSEPDQSNLFEPNPQPTYESPNQYFQ